MTKETTKDKILKAARTLFVAQGFAGTSVGNIAKLAQVNHSLIFHHFKNKELLWISVKQDIVAEASNKRSILPGVELSFDAFLKELFFRKIQFYRENPDIIRMINWQRLERDSSHAIGVTNSAEMQRWINSIAHYQSEGEIVKGYKPEWIVTFILSIISSAALDPNIYIGNEQDLSNYIGFCIEILKNSLTGFN
ncbi:MAG: TetR/AcrR family transcriptional regulator [Tatlockia sp.]|nr:TetR/AcrR family transcriptional regulator [Tatlockia sp.]